MVPLDFLTRPQASAQVLLVGVMSRPDQACAIDAEVGRTLWTRAASLFALGNSRAVLLTDDKLECVAARDSKVLWSVNLSGVLRHNWRNLAIAGERVFLAARDRMMCFDITSGKLLWVHDEKPGGYHKEAVVALASTSTLIVVMYYRAGGSIIALNAADGTEAWRYQPSSSIPLAPPWVSGNSVLVRTQAGVEALDTATGKLRWQTRQSLPDHGGVGVAMVGSRVYSVSGDVLRELNPTDGAIMRQRILPEPLYGIPGATLADVGGRLGIIGMQTRGEKDVRAGILLYDPTLAEIAYADRPFEKTVIGQLAVAGDRLFFVGFDGVAAFDIGP